MSARSNNDTAAAGEQAISPTTHSVDEQGSSIPPQLQSQYSKQGAVNTFSAKNGPVAFSNQHALNPSQFAYSINQGNIQQLTNNINGSESNLIQQGNSVPGEQSNPGNNGNAVNSGISLLTPANAHTQNAVIKGESQLDVHNNNNNNNNPNGASGGNNNNANSGGNTAGGADINGLNNAATNSGVKNNFNDATASNNNNTVAMSNNAMNHFMFPAGMMMNGMLSGANNMFANGTAAAATMNMMNPILFNSNNLPQQQQQQQQQNSAQNQQHGLSFFNGMASIAQQQSQLQGGNNAASTNEATTGNDGAQNTNTNSNNQAVVTTRDGQQQAIAQFPQFLQPQQYQQQQMQLLQQQQQQQQQQQTAQKQDSQQNLQPQSQQQQQQPQQLQATQPQMQAAMPPFSMSQIINPMMLGMSGMILPGANLGSIQNMVPQMIYPTFQQQFQPGMSFQPSNQVQQPVQMVTPSQFNLPAQVSTESAAKKRDASTLDEDSYSMSSDNKRPKLHVQITEADKNNTGPSPILPSKEGLSAFHDYDVLCGRGGGTNVHPGNRNFRDLINLHRRAYLKARKNDKPAISRAIVRTIRESDGRFLKKDERTGQWYEIGDDSAREKTSQALRQRAPEMRKLLFDTEREEARAAAESHVMHQTQQMIGGNVNIPGAMLELNGGHAEMNPNVTNPVGVFQTQNAPNFAALQGQQQQQQQYAQMFSAALLGGGNGGNVNQMLNN